MDSRQAKWAQIVKDRENSGLTVREFCVQNQIRESTFYNCQGKLRKRDYVNHLEVAPRGFVKLLTSPQENAQSESFGTLLVEVGGCKISVSHDTDFALLAKTCRALQNS